MEIKKRKKPTAALLAVVFSSVVFGGVMIYQKTNSSLQNIDEGKNATITAKIAPSTPKKIVVKSTANISNFLSPFSQIPSNTSASETFIPRQVPPIPNGIFPSLPSGQVISPSSIIVKAIFYGGDVSQNIAIVAVNTDEITVKEGSNSRFGFVSSITKDSVMINNNLYVMDKGAKSTNVNTPIDSNRPPVFPFNILDLNQK